MKESGVEIMMDNPWKKIAEKWINNRKPPFIFPKDMSYIGNFNTNLKEYNNEYKILQDLLPDPFVGDIINAEVFFLQLNPGATIPPGLMDASEKYLYKLYPKLFEEIISNLKQEKKRKYPFYYLNLGYRLSGGFSYWTKVLSRFLKSEEGYLSLSKKVCVVEYFPYHSRHYKNLGEILECQKFSFEIVKNAIDNNKMVIILRSEKLWKDALKKFAKPGGKNWAKKLYSLNNSRNVIITEKNFKDKNGFETLKKILK